MTLFVVLNTCVLAMDHYGISNDMAEALNNLNLAFTIIFCAELVLKMLGLGYKLYFKDTMNCFDFFVVSLSMIDLFVLSGSSALSAFRTIRIFRVFRIVRVFRNLQSMTMIIRVIGRTFSQFIYLALLLLLFILIFTLIGMQMFGGKFNFDDGKPRTNFDTFFSAFMTVFQLLTVEDWTNGIRAIGPLAISYYLVWLVLGNFMLLNLFLAILLNGFSEEVDSIDNIEEEANLPASLRKLIRRREEAQKIMDEDEEQENTSSFLMKDDAEKSKPLFSGVSCEWSYLMFSKANGFRVFCYRVTSSRRFEWGILVIIILNTIKLVWDTYLLEEPADSKQLEVSADIDLAFTVIFGIEFLLKSIAMGFFREKGSYLTEGWNKLDFLIVVISVVEASVSGINLSSLKVLRLLRTLRPLRFISHNNSMKLVVTALLESIAAILNVAIVVLIIWLIFAILGMSLFSGKFHYCTNPALTTKTECEDYGHSWLNYSSNFDNTYEAIKTLFIIGTMEDFQTVMYRAMDTTEVDHAQKTDANPAAAAYFLVFMMLGTFFFMNLFIGVIFEKYELAKKGESSLSVLFMKYNQIFWVEMQQLVAASKPQIEIKRIPEGKFCKFFYKVAKSTPFEIFIMACIVLNMLQMSVAYYEASDAYRTILENINIGFTAVFIVEAIIKLIGFSIVGYFSQGWNQFDFFVVSASIVDLSLTYFGGSAIKFLRVGPQLARIIRVLRVSKLFRIVKSMKSIQELLRILGYSLPAVFNILSLLLLVYFIYAIMGVYLFNSVTTGNVIDDYTNFSNFGMAVITLLRCSTGEDWPTIMYDCMVTEEVTTTLFFLSFILITNFVMLNMFIMIILQQWEILANNPENVVHVFKHNTTNIKAAWSQYSAKYKGIKCEFTHIGQLMTDLGPGLGVASSMTDSRLQKLIYALRLPVKDGFVFYNDLLFALLRRKYRPRIEKGKDKLCYKLMEREEQATLAKLRRQREQLSAKLSSEAMMRTSLGSMLATDSNMFFVMLNVRKAFTSWKDYTASRKKGLLPNSSFSNSLAVVSTETPDKDKGPFAEMLDQVSDESA
jgi:hypothetical protein